MDYVLENHNFLRLNQEEIESMNRLTTSTKVENVIKIFQQQQKSPWPDGFTDEFH